MTLEIDEEEADAMTFALQVYKKCLEFNEASNERRRWHDSHKRSVEKLLQVLDKGGRKCQLKNSLRR